MDSHILAHIIIVCQDDGDPKLKMFILELILDSLRIHASSKCDNVLCDLTLSTMIVARFVITKIFPITYSKGHMK